MSTTPSEATVAQIGYGTTLSYAPNQSGGATFVQLGEITDIKPPKHTAAPIEIQRYDSPTLYGEMIPGWIKGGDLEFTLNYAEDQSAVLLALLNVACQFRVVKPNGKGYTYKGIFIEFGDEIPLKKEMSIKCKMVVSGAPTPYTAT